MSGSRLKLLTWNIWGGKYSDRVLSFLHTSDADIIALQEVRDGERGVGTAGYFAEALDCHYAYAPSMRLAVDGREQVLGNAILSRFPIVGRVHHQLSPGHPRTAVQADIDVSGAVFHAVSVHLTHSHQQPSPVQEEQAISLIRLIPDRDSVIMGDFNSLPDSPTIAIMKSRFRQSDGEELPTWCLYPDGCAVCKPQSVRWKLDYIFTSGERAAIGNNVGKSTASDHLPVVSEIVV